MSMERRRKKKKKSERRVGGETYIGARLPILFRKAKPRILKALSCRVNAFAEAMTVDNKQIDR